MVDYLVTGGAGFIGSHIVEHLLKKGQSVRVIDNFYTGRRENLDQAKKWEEEGKGRFELIEDDIRDLKAVKQAVQGCRYILHQAAIPAVPRSVKDPITTSEVNIQGTLNLLVAAKDAKLERFVYASSSSVYGDTKVLPKREDMPPSPLSPYATQKLTGEFYCRVFYSLFGLPTVTLRYFNVFGPRQDPLSTYAAVVPNFVTAVLNDETPVIYGDGKQTRDFTYVENVVDANIKASTAPEEAYGKVFNIACGKNINLLKLLSIIAGFASKKAEPKFDARRPGDVRDSLADISPAQKILGYRPNITVEQGLEKTFHYYKDL